MIHHVSIDADEPKRAAGVLAQLMGGHVLADLPFEDAYMAVAADEHGTLIEVWQRGTVSSLVNSRAPGTIATTEEHPQFTPFHVAISVSLDEEGVRDVAGQAGWAVARRKGGPFDVMEVWVENRLLVEVLTPEMAADYLRATVRKGSPEPHPA